MKKQAPSTTIVYPSFFRRLAAILYDWFLVTAILMIGTFILMPLTHGEAISHANVLYQAFLWLLVFGFFVGFWYKSGQTLGMMAWRIRLVSDDNTKPTFTSLCLRFGGAILSLSIFGLGFLWALLNKKHYTWHDFISGTHLVVEKKQIT